MLFLKGASSKSNAIALVASFENVMASRPNDRFRCHAAIETRTDPCTSHRFTMTFSAMIGHHEADFPLDHAHTMRMVEAYWN